METFFAPAISFEKTQRFLFKENAKDVYLAHTRINSVNYTLWESWLSAKLSMDRGKCRQVDACSSQLQD